MSNENIVKIIQDASVDAQSLSEFMYKPADFMVERRLAPAVHTFDYYLNALDGARDNVLAELQSIKDDMRVEADNAIAQMFESGGLPATPFETKALMTASALVNGDYAQVTDDPIKTNNGLYVKKSGTWVKSEYDPLLQSKDYVDNNPLFKPTVIRNQNIDTLKTAGIYIQRAVDGGDLTTLGYPAHTEGVLQVVSSPSTALVIQTYYSTIRRITYSRFFGTSWSEWGSSQDFLATVNANPKYKAQPLKASDNLDDITVSGEYHKTSSGDILLENGYPVALAGVLIVRASISYTIQEYTPFSTGITYKRLATLGNFKPWTKEVDIPDIKSPLILEWQKNTPTTAHYNNSTKTFELKGQILAAASLLQGRLILSSFTVDLTDASRWAIAYIDMEDLPSDGTIDATNAETYIKVGAYTNTYKPNPKYIPLFKYHRSTDTVEACAGFIDITNESDIQPSSAEAPSQFSKTATSIDIYYSQPSGKKLRTGVIYQFYGDDPLATSQSASDLWRIRSLVQCNSDNTTIRSLTSTGEFELAIRHGEDTQVSGVGKDHVGGVHGDEKLIDIKFFVDGCLIDADAVIPFKSFDEIQMIQHSVIYFQNTTRPLADHIKIVTFKDGLINVKQVVDFKYEELTVLTAWVAMLPIYRTVGDYQITDASARSNDMFLQVDDNTTSDFSNRFTPIVDGTVIKQWSTASNISAKTTLIKTPNFSATQNAFVTNSPLYNKLYISATDGSKGATPVTIPLGTVWDIETEYDVKC